MRVAVTGAGGRLGRALIEALAEAPYTGLAGPIAWHRAQFDLDAPNAVGDLIVRDEPEVVIHAAAWTDVDGCAREPELALARNGSATGVLARACVAHGVDLVIVSTNEVFDGRRTAGAGYGPDDAPSPINPYGRSKVAGERAAADAFAGATARLGIVRTAWLFGPPGNDFPAKILTAAERAQVQGEPVRAVADEHGSPTYTRDLAEALVELLGDGDGDVGGVRHLVNGGVTSRAGWARELFRQARIDIPIEEVPGSTWPRASTPPQAAILRPTPLPSGQPLRPWQEALADYLPALLRQRAVAAR